MHYGYSANLVLEIKNFTCRVYNQRIKVMECAFSKYGTSYYGLSARMMFDRDVDRSFKAHVALDVMPKNTRQTMHVADMTFNVCVFLKQMLNNQILRPLALELKRVCNLPAKCPFKKDFMYETKNFTVTAKTVPPYLPLMDFEFKVEIYDKNQIIGNWIATGATSAKAK
ncbi:uncharacterized protein [Musca autumnalis]|uniref:uncharacterized protein n=1 Tax=Musca autumnalis TaxID=221902 RepID=UPI003CF76E59